jgi:hypothetical protein
MKTNSYDGDFSEWAKQQAKLLRSHEFSKLDAENMAEELEAIAREEQRSFRDQIAQIIIFMVHQKVTPDSSDLGTSILDSQLQAQLLLDDSPSLKDLLPKREFQDKVWRMAKLKFNAKTIEKPQDLPDQCPFNLEDIIYFKS